MTKAERLDKLISILAVAYTWAYISGEWLLHENPIKIKKHGRPAKSIFKLGYTRIRNVLLNLHDQLKRNLFAHFIRLLAIRLEVFDAKNLLLSKG